MRHHQGFAAAAGDRWMAADAAGFCGVLAGERANDAGRFQRRFDVDADDAGKSMRRADKIGKGLVRQRRVGDVAAVAADQRVIFDAPVE